MYWYIPVRTTVKFSYCLIQCCTGTYWYVPVCTILPNPVQAYRIPDDPTASIHQRSAGGTLLRLCYCGVLRAGAPPAKLWRTQVPVTRSEATVARERWMGADRTTRRSRNSADPTGGGPEQEDRGRIRADYVYPGCWRSIH
jgi:hypothetical protein